MAETADAIPWHPAFVQAIKLELDAYRDALEFIAEYRLSSEPLEIDVVIVKKAPDQVIEKNIARIFQRINILEYKTPVEDLTLSVIETRHPRELLKYVEAGGGTATESSPGIYHIAGYPLAIQVIESKKLPIEENLWLKGLAKDLNPAIAGSILVEGRKKGTAAELAAYLYALVTANLKTIQEVVAMADEILAFDRWVEEMGWAAKWEAQAEIRGEKATWEKVLGLLKQGYTVEQLERMSPSATADS